MVYKHRMMSEQNGNDMYPFIHGLYSTSVKLIKNLSLLFKTGELKKSIRLKA
jgi:hypothetical protein